MKIIKRSIERDHSGTLVLSADDAEDMWYIYNLVQIGDLVETKTPRNVTQQARDGTKIGPPVRKLLRLQIKVTKIDFDASVNTLRVGGPVMKDAPDVSSGTYHTIQLETQRAFDLFKDEWDAYALSVVEDASNIENKTDVAAVVLQPGLAHVCLVADAVTVVRAKVEKSIPRKRRGDNSDVEKAIEKFLDNVYRAIVRNLNLDAIKVVLLASPGMLANDLYQHIFEKASIEENSQILRAKSKFLVSHASSGHLHSLAEALKDEQVQKQLQDTRYGRESAVLEKFFRALNDDDMRAFYGPHHVDAAVERGAVESLMVSDSLFRSREPTERKRYIDLAQTVKDMGREVLVFSSFHQSGEQLESLGGVACTTLYPCPELEDLEEEEEE